MASARICLQLLLSGLLVWATALPVGGEQAGTGSLRPDPLLQTLVGRAVREMGLSRLVNEGRLAVSFVDLNDPGSPRYAGLNDREMM
jgi:hypothetical protein